MAMRKTSAGAAAICAFLMVATCFSMAAMAGNDDQKVRVIVLFKDKADDKLIKDKGGDVLVSYDNIPALVTELKPGDINDLKKNSKIIAVEGDGECYIIDNDANAEKTRGGGGPGQPTQQTPWGISKVGAVSVWGSTTGNGVKVAILDTGVDTDHPDLPTPLGGKNFINTRKSYDDDNGHGTHCAGIIAAKNNLIGVVGVAPEAGIYAVKVLNSAGTGSWSGIIAGIDWVITQNTQNNAGIKIISMSLGGGGSQVLQDACTRAQNAGILIIAAAGNNGGTVIYPAAYPNVIAVSATDSSDAIASFSSRGPQIDLAAPGVSVYSTYKGGGYATYSGTSMACPHVSGVAALVLQAHPGYSRADLISAIEDADDIGDEGIDDLFGFGLVNAPLAIS